MGLMGANLSLDQIWVHGVECMIRPWVYMGLGEYIRIGLAQKIFGLGFWSIYITIYTLYVTLICEK